MAFWQYIHDIDDVENAIARHSRRYIAQVRGGGGGPDEIQDTFLGNQAALLDTLRDRMTPAFRQRLTGPDGLGTPLLQQISNMIHASMNPEMGAFIDAAIAERRPNVPRVREVIPTNRYGTGAQRRAFRRRFTRQFSLGSRRVQN